MSNENLHDLISSLYDADNVDGVEEDIRIGDEIIASGGELVPDSRVITGIKGDISKRLISRQSRRMQMVSLRTAVAAIIVIAAFFGIQKMLRQGPSPIPRGVVSNIPWLPDATAGISAELDTLEDAILSVGLEEAEAVSDDIIWNLEMEVADTGGGFWR